MSRARDARQRRRPAALTGAPRTARPLWRGEDHGEEVRLVNRDFDSRDDRWLQPFLDANREALRQLDVSPRVDTSRGVALALKPGARIGATPILHPTTRRVHGGLLIEPRARWPQLGAVLDRLGFRVDTRIGGPLLVPGSAREVPSWVLAGPVLARLERSMNRLQRGFVHHEEVRASPRGTIDWQDYCAHRLPNGEPHRLRCRFPEPAVDPAFTSAARWTLARLEDELAPFAAEPVGRHLLQRSANLARLLGTGPLRRPARGQAHPGLSEFQAAATEAMTWVAEERGLGGARSLDGLAWDLDIDAVWEQWVAAFLEDLAPRIGLRRSTTSHHSMAWRGLHSMASLRPDAVLHGRNRTVVVDAKYKRHLALLARRSWRHMSEAARDAHRADLHQILAYAALQPGEQVDAVLTYPWDSKSDTPPPTGVSLHTVGTRRVRVMLTGLPFGFRSTDGRESALREWGELFRTNAN